MRAPWGSLPAQFGRHGRRFAEEGLSEELSGDPTRLIYAQVSEALTAAGGEQAMVQNIAEKYIASLATMANDANMIIVPDSPNDVSGVVTTALALGKQVAAKA